MIVLALATGTAAGIGNTATMAVQDAYASLKSLVRARLERRGQDVQVLEADQVGPNVWRTRLEQALTASDATSDDLIQTAAQRLLALTDPEGHHAGRYQVTVTNNYGTTAGQITAPVTINYGQLPDPPAPPAAT